MDSPETSKAKPASAASPAVQDSPFLRYVSSLSPLPTVNVSAGVIAYGDLSLPSPEPVFKSPHFNQPRKLKRSQNLPLTDAEKLSPEYANDATDFLESMQMTETSSSQSTFQLIPIPGKQRDGDCLSQVQQCSSPSSCIDVFLADSSASCDNPSTDHSLKQAAEMPQDIGDSCIGTNKNEITCLKKDAAQSHPDTSSDLVGDFTTPVDFSASSDIADPQSMQATIRCQALRNKSTSIEETIVDISSNEECTTTKGTESLTLSCQSEENAGSEPSFCVNLHQNEGQLKMVGQADEGNETLVDELPAQVSNNDSIDATLCLAPATGTQHGLSSEVWDVSNNPSFRLNEKGSDAAGHRKASPITSVVCCHATQDVEPYPAETERWGEFDSTCQLLVESIQDTQIDNFLYKSGSNSVVCVGNQIPYDEEEGAQHQGGMRKRLQFDTIENRRTSIGCNKSFRNLTNDVSKAGSPVTSLEAETLTSYAEFVATSSNELMIQSVSGNALCKLPLKVDRSGQKKRSSPRTAPRPSGIGLHLNSLGGGQINPNISMQSSGDDLGVEVEGSHFESNDATSHDLDIHLASTSVIGQTTVNLTTSSESQLLYPAAESSLVMYNGNQAGKQSKSSVSYQPHQDGKPFGSSMQPKLLDRYMTPSKAERLNSEDATLSLETGQSSPRKKRKKAPDNEGHKHCNCKRSKCLKLYCDCFAAGTFCTEACACHECFNRLEHEDTVHETRKQIESRNPLAFAPKVIVRVSDPPRDNEAGKHLTPTSARHKRGCNCKKSLCLKKYCECYQAGVGCSLGCRCDGCKNPFGRKDGCEIIEIEHKKSKVEGWETDSSGGKFDRAHVKRVVINTTKCCSRLSPLTPSVQVSSGIDVPNSQLPTSYCTSPESSTSPLPYFEGSPSSPVDSLSNNTLALVPYNEDSRSQSAIKVDAFLPGWDGFADICNCSPLANPSPSTSGASAAPKIRESKVLQTKLFQGSTRLSVGSLRWRSSPVTPLPQFGERKIVLEPDSDAGLHNNLEDDTPEILKDTHSPIKAVKANSPKQKRVSPPQRHLHGTRSTSAPGLRSSRKFILRSVPSFPPLTPYSNNSKGHGT